MIKVINKETGEEVDLSKILTMVYDLKLTGSNGTEKYFLRNRQYQFEDTSNRNTYYDRDLELTTAQSYVLHYRVSIDDEDFYVPSYFIAIEGFLREESQQDWEIWRQKKADQPRDAIGAYKDVTGIDLKNRNQELFNGYDYWLELLKKKKKKYGKFYDMEQDDEDAQTY